MKGLIVKAPWINLILDGHKTWEIRGSHTSIRGQICLIQSGTGKVMGTVELVDSQQLTEEEYKKGKSYHCIEDCFRLPYPKSHAWILRNPVRFDKPIPYQHPQGAVIWVNLPDEWKASGR